MKIALVSCFYSPRIGGVEKYTERLAENLPNTKIFTSEDKAPKQTEFLPYHQIGKFKIPHFRTTYQKLKNFSPDLIHLNGPLPHATIIAIIARLLHIPTILTYHGDPTPTNPLLKIAAFIDRQLYRFIFNQIIVTSPKYKNRVAKFFPKNRIHITYLGIDPEFLKPRTRQSTRKKLKLNPTVKYILFVAKLDENHYYKGIKTFLQTARQNPNLNFLIIGDGPTRPQLQSQAPKNTTFLGTVSTPTLADYFTAADIFTLPSHSASEGFGLVLLESAACSTPVITTTAVGSSQFITKHNIGLLIPPKNPEKLSQAIKKLLQNSPNYKKLQKNCRSISRQMTWQKTAEETKKIHNSLKPNT